MPELQRLEIILVELDRDYLFYVFYLSKNGHGQIVVET
jgi:hypothetical protein